MQMLKDMTASAIDALKASPMMLGVLVLNGMLLLAVYVAVKDQRAHMAEQSKMILERCLPK